MSPFSVCCLLCYIANWLHIALIVYEFQALRLIHHWHVIVSLGVDKWTLRGGGGSYGVLKDRKIVKMHSNHHTRCKEVIL